jgi:hypothetical protein
LCLGGTLEQAKALYENNPESFGEMNKVFDAIIKGDAEKQL